MINTAQKQAHACNNMEGRAITVQDFEAAAQHHRATGNSAQPQGATWRERSLACKNAKLSWA
jgi:hypothetical protein